MNPYEPPENDSIIQTASLLQTDQPTTSTTKPINRNTAWRHNNNAGTTVGTHRTTSVTGTDNRSGTNMLQMQRARTLKIQLHRKSLL